MRTHAKAPTAGSTSGHGISRGLFGLFGLSCLCVLGLAAFLGSSAPFAPAAESLPGQGFLPDGRAWEMVSPSNKEGGEVAGNATRSQAAANGSAFRFLSLQAFADAVGSSNGTEYIAERSDDPDPGTNGWSTHAITPAQESQTPLTAGIGLEPSFQGALSADLDTGAFKAWSPIPGAADPDPDVANLLSNLYRGEGLRSGGGYRLASPCDICVAPILVLNPTAQKLYYASASTDFDHLLFEWGLNLAAGASGGESNHKTYEWSDGALRLAGVLPGGTGAVRSVPGQGAGSGNRLRISLHPISTDGSRIAFTVPTGTTNREGPIYSRINADTTIQLNASERAVPDTPKPARYWDASTDHSRVFFQSNEALTEDAPIGSAKLYMWKKAEADEQQSLKVDASGGSFKLTLATQPATFTGTLATSGSNVKKATSVSVTSGALSVGQTVSGTGISPGTTITAMGDFSSTAQSQLTLSANSTVGGSQSLTAILNATTAALPLDATAQQVQEALEALKPIGQGNVIVTGGPGSPGGLTPYTITFMGDLAGVNMPQLSADSSSLSGGAATASVTTTQAIKNLSFLSVDEEPADGGGLVGVIGASDDGRYVYFIANGQLVAGKPASIGSSLYLWHEGVISFIGKLLAGPDGETFSGGDIALFRFQPRVTPDGRHLLFNSKSGEGLLSAHGGTDYDHGGGFLRELYAYSADTDELECASCNPSGAPATVNAVARERFNAGSSLTGTYVSRVISDDGRYVFFTTAEALVPDDINGKRDAYLYDTQTGKPHLLSSGESPGDSYFLDASADGKDAFFITQEQLSGWDMDAAYDLYDARVGGGFPEPPTPPSSCQGDACQPAPISLNDPTPASSSFNGSGNEQGRKPKPSCPRGKRKVKARNGKTRCVKRQTNRARDAKNDRRAGR